MSLPLSFKIHRICVRIDRYNTTAYCVDTAFNFADNKEANLRDIQETAGLVRDALEEIEEVL